jgi:hypothetical protein
MRHRVSVVLLLFSLFRIEIANAQRTPAEARSFSLSVEDGRVTAAINGIPLHMVLEELGRHVSLRLALSESWRDHSVIAQFSALPLDEALARLLTGLPYGLIIYGPPATASVAAMPAVELIVSARSPHMTTVSLSEPAVALHSLQPQQAMLDVSPAWSAVLQHPDPAVRLQALSRWAEQDTATVLNPLTQALVDADESVRTRAQALVERVWAAKPERAMR